MSKRGGRINSLNNKIKCSDRLQKKNFYFIILILILGLSFGTIFYLQLGPEINHLNKDIENALDAYSLGNIQRTDLIKTFSL